MKRTIPAVFAFVSTALIFSALVLAPSACGKKKDSVAERNNFLMTEGKTFLNSASYMLAEEEFQKVIDENLPAKAEARFAIALCETLHLVDTVSYFVDIFGSKTASATFGLAPLAGEVDESDYIFDAIFNMATGVLQGLQTASDNLDEVKKESNFSFRTTRLPVYFQRKEIMDLKGNWDMGDVYLLDSIVKDLLGGTQLVLSQDFNLDFFGVFQFAKHRILSNGIDIDEAATINTPLIMNIVVWILNDANSPEFLNLSNEDLDGNGVEDGKEFLQRAGANLGNGADDIVKLVNYKTSNPIPADDMISYKEKQERTGTTTRSLLIKGRIADKIVNGEQQYKDVEIPVTDGLISGMSAMRDNLLKEETDPSRRRIEWWKDMVPVLSALGVAVLTSVDLSTFIDVPSEIKIPTGLITPDIVEAFIKGLIGDTFQVDAGYFFRHPVAIRNILMAWRSDIGYEDQNNFMFEWECPYDVGTSAPGLSDSFPGKSRFSCASDAVLIDSEHFANPDFAKPGIPKIDRDSMKMKYPYFPFKDPSFNGLLYVDPSAFDITAGVHPLVPGFARADLWSVNALIASILKF